MSGMYIKIFDQYNLHPDDYVTGGVKFLLNRDSNPGPLAYRANALTTELLRPDILIDSHSPVNRVSYIHFIHVCMMCLV